VPTLLSSLIALLAIVTVACFVAPRLRVPAPVLLALAGFLVALTPGITIKRLDPSLILVLFLPPLLYSDAFDTSWVDFRRWLRPILMLAVGLVAVVIAVVGVLTKHLLPELPWAACFTLGAIVAPTDTVAVQSVIERLRVPRRLTAILGGESLVNDATGLVGVQIGVALLLSGTFEAGAVLGTFAWVAGGGILIGVVVGALFSVLNRFVGSVEPLFTLSLLAPYMAFATAHELETSGVLAVVTSGFIVSWNIHTVPPHARLRLYSTWELVIFVLNALCFVFIGLEAPHVLQAPDLGDRAHVVTSGLLIALAVIVVRLAWMFPAAYLPLFLMPRVRRREGGFPSWRGVLVSGWCGVRGIISLAAALSLPVALRDGSPFPGRSTIIFLALCVILVTLFVQGTTLQPLVRLLGLREDEDDAEDVRAAREALLAAGIARLDAFCSEHSCPISVHHWRTSMKDELASLREEDSDGRRAASSRLAVQHDVRSAVLEAQSNELLKLRDGGAINDRTYLQLQLDLDREQAAHEGATV
jgi:monovalent cation/hydrogen antiporter